MAGVPSEHPLLPERIKALNQGISPWFPLGDEYQVDTQEQVKTNNLGKAVRIAASPCSCHFVVHLGSLRDPQVFPYLNQMPAQGDSLFIRELACGSRMACHVQSMEGIESGDPCGALEISRSHQVCLMKVAHPFCLNGRIGLMIAITFSFNSAGLSIAREDPGNRGNRWNSANSSLGKLPMNNLCSNSREGRTPARVRLQFFSDGQYFPDHTLRGLSPDSVWSTALIFKARKSLVFVSAEPFGEPTLAPMNQVEDFIETDPLPIKLYCLAPFFIFVVILHRLTLLPGIAGRSLGDSKLSSRCYDIF
jgi:hypothetical protein